MSNIIISGNIDDAMFQYFVKKFTKQTESPINVIINSDGGDEHVGRAIAGFIKASGRDVHTYGFGAVHSTAVIVFAAGNVRRLSKAAVMLVHESSDKTKGKSTEIRKFAKDMEKSEEFWCELLQEYTGTDAKTWLKLHAAETYLSPEEALKLNLATELI
jgi:ATP-dependent protease ClpP protease subunit